MGLGQIPSSGGGGGTPPVADTILKRLALTPDALTGSSALSALSITQTLNTSGSPDVWLLDITNTASGADTKLVNLKVGGSSKFSVDLNGNVIMGTSLNLQYGAVIYDPLDGIVLRTAAFGGAQSVLMQRSGGASATNFGLVWQGITGLYSDTTPGQLTMGATHATTATTQTIKAHDVTTGNAANLIAKGGTSGGGGSNGLFGFGTHSSVGAETITGYVTIVDEGGTPRKLAVIS